MNIGNCVEIINMHLDLHQKAKSENNQGDWEMLSAGDLNLFENIGYYTLYADEC